VYLWTRDPTLCDAPTAAGPGFDLSLAEGPINLAPGVECSFPGGAVTTAAIEELTPLTGDRRLALTALFARETLRTRVAVSQAEIDRTEREVVKRVFRGSLAAYLRELKRRHATRAVAKGVIADELRRRLIAQSPTPLLWAADIGVAAVREATCLRDEVPGVGDFPRSDEREIGVAPLPSYLPFLFVDRTPPAAPSGVTAAPATGGVTVDWADASESDAIGYAVYRAPAPAGPYKQVTLGIVPRSTYFDAAAPPGVASYYFVRVVDSSHNLSKLSAAASATPG
jgi:hypothetical protein